MNLARQLCTVHQTSVSRNLIRNFRVSASSYDGNASQPQVQEEKYDFEDIQVHERTERRKPKIPPFAKDTFVSIFNRDLLAFPEVLNKDESEDVERRVDAINKVFSDSQKTKADRRDMLKKTKMYSAPVSLTRNGLAMNHTESLRYIEAIGGDLELGQEISDHWVGLKALQHGLTAEQYNGVIDDLTTGEKTITLCIKERIAERLTQADFRTSAEMDGHGVWRISGEKVCDLADGYLLVLATVEATQLKAFLVHPSAYGVTVKDGYVDFLKTPATPLTAVSMSELAQLLSISRLLAAALCRERLRQATLAAVDYATERVLGGKPLSELATIRACVGDALLELYAGESAQYFTAGLLDAYHEPDAEVEVAMCRNFMAKRGLSTMLRLTQIASAETPGTEDMLHSMRRLAARGESLDSVDNFIAMNGIHHAGKMMAEEIKQIRNPLMHPAFIFKKAIANRHQEKDDPKLTLRLEEHLHPSLRVPAAQLEYSVLRLRYACETIMARHGQAVASAHTELSRLAEAGTEVLTMTAVLARASRAYCIGLRNAEIEMKLASSFVDSSKERVRRLVKEIDDGEYLNLDHFRLEFGRKVLDSRSMLVEKPTARVFW